MAVRKIRHSWWVDFRFDYTRIRKRSPENSRAGALAYEALLRHGRARGEALDERKPQEQTFQQFAEAWFTGYVITNNKPSEQRQKQLTLKSSLIPFFGKMRLSAIGKRDIELYKAREQQKAVSNKTINNKLTVLRKCLATAHEWDAMQTVPPAIKQLKCPPAVTEFLTPDEAKRLLAHAAGVLRDMIQLALRTGLRQGEILGLQWEAIDWENRVLTVRHSFCDYTRTLTSPKSNRERHVPLASEIYELLHARKQNTGYVFTNKQGQPFSQDSHLRHLRGAQKHAGLRKIGWHTLRHTFATHLTAKGASLRVVQELLGHSTITMTMRYAHVAAPSLREAISLLSAPDNATMRFGQPVVNAMQWNEEMAQMRIQSQLRG